VRYPTSKPSVKIIAVLYNYFSNGGVSNAERGEVSEMAHYIIFYNLKKVGIRGEADCSWSIRGKRG